MDVLGRVIETRANITETSNLIFGNNLTPGAYLAEIIQGTNRKVIKTHKNVNKFLSMHRLCSVT
jgi:hypothetical protein